MKSTDLPRATFPLLLTSISNSGLTITASRIEHVRSRIKVRITRHVAHHFHSAIPVSRCSHHDQSGVTAQMH